MSNTSLFLSVENVLMIHTRMLTEFGGAKGIRDRGLLESAVAMPRQLFGGLYLHPEIPSQAAAYLFHICKNHPFIDGNKRSALASAEFFVILNGYQLCANNNELVNLTLSIASGETSKDELVCFFKSRVMPEGFS